MSKKLEKILATKIIEASNAYYNDQPTIEDHEFDALVDELRKLNPQHSVLGAVGAPVKAVSEWLKVKHEIPMQSLNKVNTAEELASWAKECDSDVNAPKGFLICEKLDGISVSTIWENGKLVLACSRGDGTTGEDITANVIKMKGIPKEIKGFTGNIRGEIVLLKPDFDKHFPDYSNQRNAASGIAKRFDGDGVQHLTVLMYTVAAGKDFKTEEDQFKWLQSSGLKTPNFFHCQNLDAVNKVYDEYGKHLREKLEYLIDGLVVRLNDIDLQQGFGEKSHRPQGQRAYKFTNQSSETILIDVIWQAGKSGRISPVAIVKPVIVAGVTIERASLHNNKIVQNLKLFKGCSVLVSRRNDVVPYIERNLSE